MSVIYPNAVKIARMNAVTAAAGTAAAESNGDQEITGDGTGEALPEIELEPKPRKSK